MIGSPVIELDVVSSTNQYAEELIKTSRPAEGTLILAHKQTAGKGQGDNTWESETGRNLTFTVILHPDFLLPEQQFLLNKAISLAITDHISILIKDKPVKIKWPNDIYLDNKKLGGILINNIINGNIFETAIAGIGLNINQVIFSKDIPNPVSLKQILGYDLDLKGQLTKLCNGLESRYESLLKKKFSILDNDYNSILLGYSEWRTYQAGKTEFEGRIKGVDEFGRIQIETREGKTHTYSHGELDIEY